MGGNKGGRLHKLRNVICVFVFTTLWHGDFELRLLIWGCLMALLIIPETLIKSYYHRTDHPMAVRCRGNERLNRYVHAFGAVANILMLFVANLIGFGPGYEMVVGFVKVVVFKWICAVTFCVIYFIVFCGVLIMFHADYAQNVKGYGWDWMLGIERKERKKLTLQHQE